MKRVVEAVARTMPLEFSEVDIDTNPDLRRLYDWEVPVLAVDGRKAFKYRVSEGDLRAVLGRGERSS